MRATIMLLLALTPGYLLAGDTYILTWSQCHVCGRDIAREVKVENQLLFRSGSSIIWDGAWHPINDQPDSVRQTPADVKLSQPDLCPACAATFGKRISEKLQRLWTEGWEDARDEMKGSRRRYDDRRIESRRDAINKSIDSLQRALKEIPR